MLPYPTLPQLKYKFCRAEFVSWAFFLSTATLLLSLSVLVWRWTIVFFTHSSITLHLVAPLPRHPGPPYGGTGGWLRRCMYNSWTFSWKGESAMKLTSMSWFQADRSKPALRWRCPISAPMEHFIYQWNSRNKPTTQSRVNGTSESGEIAFLLSWHIFFINNFVFHGTPVILGKQLSSTNAYSNRCPFQGMTDMNFVSVFLNYETIIKKLVLYVETRVYCSNINF